MSALSSLPLAFVLAVLAPAQENVWFATDDGGRVCAGPYGRGSKGAVLAQELPREPNDGVRIWGRLVTPSGSPVPNRAVMFRNQVINEPLHDSKIVTDEKGSFAFCGARGKRYEVSITVTNELFTGIGTIEIAEGQDVSMGDIVFDVSSQEGPIVHFSGPLRINGFLSAKSSGKVHSIAPTAQSIAAVYIACSAIPNEYCSGSKVHIVLDDGTDVLPPIDKDQVGGSSASIAKDRRAAVWLADYGNCCTSYPLSMELIVYKPGKPLQKFKGDGRGIFNWQFVAEGKKFAFFQDVAHGPGNPHCELRDIETGRLISKWDGRITQKSPFWARKIGAGF
jgi:hypothetical protein